MLRHACAPKGSPPSQSPAPRRSQRRGGSRRQAARIYAVARPESVQDAHGRGTQFVQRPGGAPASHGGGGVRLNPEGGAWASCSPPPEHPLFPVPTSCPAGEASVHTGSPVCLGKPRRGP